MQFIRERKIPFVLSTEMFFSSINKCLASVYKSLTAHFAGYPAGFPAFSITRYPASRLSGASLLIGKKIVAVTKKVNGL